MPSAQLLRQQIETALSDRIPSALTPAPCVIRPTASTGIPALDDALSGGLPIGSHFLARFGQEETLLQLAGQLERSHPWKEVWPRLDRQSHSPLTDIDTEEGHGT